MCKKTLRQLLTLSIAIGGLLMVVPEADAAPSGKGPRQFIKMAKARKAKMQVRTTIKYTAPPTVCWARPIHTTPQQ
jgi:hypothetical protein